MLPGTLQMACAPAATADALAVLDHPGLGRWLGPHARPSWSACFLEATEPCALPQRVVLRVLHRRSGLPPRARRRGRPHSAGARRARSLHHQPAPGARLRASDRARCTPRASSRCSGRARRGARPQRPERGSSSRRLRGTHVRAVSQRRPHRPALPSDPLHPPTPVRGRSPLRSRPLLGLGAPLHGRGSLLRHRPALRRGRCALAPLPGRHRHLQRRLRPALAPAGREQAPPLQLAARDRGAHCLSDPPGWPEPGRVSRADPGPRSLSPALAPRRRRPGSGDGTWRARAVGPNVSSGRS